MRQADTTFSTGNKTSPIFYFIGVTTAQSSMMQIFPLWMQALGRPEISLKGIDFILHDRPEAYRKLVLEIKNQSIAFGAVVTTHKIDLLQASRDLFDYLDPFAQICAEVSSISKQDGRLEGHATDPIASGLSLDAIIGKNYFAGAQREILCFGAGGSGIALLLNLIKRGDLNDQPSRLFLVDRSQQRLDNVQQMLRDLKAVFQVELVFSQDPHQNDRLMTTLPPGSLVINATGMGKDSPGSPITDDAVFPHSGVAWDFNYRGELNFLKQARRQAQKRHLRVEDGWQYFLHGWSMVISHVLHVEISGDLSRQLAAIAEAAR